MLVIFSDSFMFFQRLLMFSYSRAELMNFSHFVKVCQSEWGVLATWNIVEWKSNFPIFERLLQYLGIFSVFINFFQRLLLLSSCKHQYGGSLLILKCIISTVVLFVLWDMVQRNSNFSVIHVILLYCVLFSNFLDLFCQAFNFFFGWF